MEEMTVKEMVAALKRVRTAIIASGGTEQHGYHLPLSTDYTSAYEIAKEVSRRTNCLVPPPLCYSFSGGKLPGTTDISPETTARVRTETLVGIVQSLNRLGAG
jgi:creatinine amidohydrolase